jgi:peptidyl-tRNA hydrolase, PTH1 family
MKLIVGLGNPGLLYANNRHNIGFMCINAFSKKQGIAFNKKKGNARIGTGTINGVEVVLARPQIFMNASGDAVSDLAKRFKIAPEDLIVIHDDLDLPLGRIRIRQGGRSAGHKGIQSIIDCYESPDFFRLRVGIGHPGAENGNKEVEVIDHVLGGFGEAEKSVIAAVISRVSDALCCLLTEGIESAMNTYNRLPEDGDNETNIK